jgi:SPP1 gp7 family putative phage head morphogenesis protein
MTNANTQVHDKAIDRAAMVRLYERRLYGQIELILDGHVVRLDDLLNKGNLTPSGRKELLAAVGREIDGTYKEAYRASKRSLLDLFKDEISYAYQNVEAAMGRIWRAERPSNRVAEEFVLNKPLYEDRTLHAGWAGVSVGERRRIERVIRSGISEGHTIDRIARDVRRGNVHRISRNQSRALVATAVTSVGAQADHAVYEANGKALAGWQYVAVLDGRTTALCAHRDGTVYPVSDTRHLPPAHFNCRSTTVPVFKSWEAVAELEGAAQVRRRNLERLTEEQKNFYDGLTPMRESYNQWLLRQPQSVQVRHLGDHKKVELFQSGKIHLDKFRTPDGASIGIRELRAMTDSGYTVPGTTRRFAAAKEKLDAMQLWAHSPDDFLRDKDLRDTLKEYYILQAQDLDGTLSLTNYRGIRLNTKSAVKRRVLTLPPREDQIVFNPITGRYDDSRIYQPAPGVLGNNMRLVRESEKLLDRDKDFIEAFVDSLRDRMGVNERAVVAENLRHVFERQRADGKVWGSFKGAAQSQIKFDVMNVSDAIETQLRKDADVFKKLRDDSYLDPVLGPTQLQTLHDEFVDNVLARNLWEDKVAPKIAKEMRAALDTDLLRGSPRIWNRVSERELDRFYLKLVHRLGEGEMPDRDQLAVDMGRDLHNMAGFNGNRDEWYKLGMRLLDSDNVSKFYEVETFGVQKRRMKSRIGGNYFGPYYDTISYNLRAVDPRMREYARLNRAVDVGMRVGILRDDNKLLVRPGYKTYFLDRGVLGMEDTRIPIVSTSSFHNFPAEFVDKDLARALNWTSGARYRIDSDYFDFVQKLLHFSDDRGKAKHYNERNEFRKYLASRGDTYERLKAMEWLRDGEKAFSNQVFVDHRGRIYERGLIGPQSGETYRPFLNSEKEKALGAEGFEVLQDQIGAFLGGLDDYFEGRHNSLSFTGKQKIAEKWRPEMAKIGNHMMRGKPDDIRAILDSDVVSRVDGEELSKFFRLSLEVAKIDNNLRESRADGERPYSESDLKRLDKYMTSFAIEQDASSSGAQIIALTTRNKQLAELSNVIPTDYKKRLYDEIAAATFNDPRFRTLNVRLGLTEKDLRKAAKAQNMVTFYGAGERTGILNVEKKLASALEKDEGTLVVKAADRDVVLSEISARIARFERSDPELAGELKRLRNDVKDIFNKGTNPGDDIMEELFFLDPKTKDLVEKMSRAYIKTVTPEDFKEIAKIMSEHLGEQVPILKDFTRFFGRLAQEYLENANPGKSDFDWSVIGKTRLLGTEKKGYVLPEKISRMMGLKAGEPVSEKLLKRLSFWTPGSTMYEIVNGVKSPEHRRTGATFFKTELRTLSPKVRLDGLKPKITVFGKRKILELKVLYANKMPKSWTDVPWVNFDGKTLEQNFTRRFDQRIMYNDDDGNRFTNIVKVGQKTSASWWDEQFGEKGKINDVADVNKARTAYPVNANHSNDAVIVKKFHLWGLKNGVPTSTVHDAFFTNIADVLKARDALRGIYADSMRNNVIKLTLDEMLARGLPREVYDRYMEEAIEKGLIPVVGRSRVGGRLLTDTDILMREDILREVPKGFGSDFGFYGVG